MNPAARIMVAGMSRPLAIQEKQRKKVKKGWVAVKVGLEHSKEGGSRKFMIRISHLHHPQFRKLLEEVKEAYGFCREGPLSLPISVDDFLHLRWVVEREAPGRRDLLVIRHLSFRSC